MQSRGAAARTEAKPQYFKNHPLEGDGFLLNLYHYLWKKDKTLESCPGVLFPHTIVYEHNFPRGWYSYDTKSGELKKRTGRELDTKTIIREFLEDLNPADPNEIVASYLSRRRTKRGRDVVYVEFFNRDAFSEFMWKRGKKGEGVLQKFVIPKGTAVDCKNSVIQAIWSPHVFTVERRTNFLKLNDARYGLYEKCVTYEGPAHYSTEFFCAPQLARRIKRICSSIVDHFRATEHKNISRMVLYFKMDNDNNVWLLWGSSLRVQAVQRGGRAIASDGSGAAGGSGGARRGANLGVTQALNLSPQFISLEASSADSSTDMYGVRRSSGNAGPVEVFRCPACQLTKKSKVSVTIESIVRQFRLQRDAERELLRKMPPQSHGASLRSDPMTPVPASPTAEASGAMPDSDKVEVLEQLDDLLYEVYSHFLVMTEEPFVFALPPKLPQLLADNLGSHFVKLGILRYPEVVQAGGGVVEAAVEAVAAAVAGPEEEEEEEEGEVGSAVKKQASSASASPASGGFHLSPVMASCVELGGDQFIIKTPLFSQARFQREIESVKLLISRRHGALKTTGGGSFRGGVDDVWKEAHDDVESRTDDVPPTLLVLFPELNNATFAQKSKNPLFLTKKVQICESCLPRFDTVMAVQKGVTGRATRRRRARRRRPESAASTQQERQERSQAEVVVLEEGEEPPSPIEAVGVAPEEIGGGGES